MKAVYISEHGGIDTLTYGDLPDPVPEAGEVLVRVRACALNRLDLWTRSGLDFWRVRFPHVLGGDIAGEVAALGPGVRSVAVGARVVLNLGVSCGTCEACLRGRDNYCPRYLVLGKDLPGGYAELVKAPAVNVVPLPDALGWEQAAALPGVFVSAWDMLFEKARVEPGEWVLVHAGGSGIGTAAIQLARLAGATVITTAGSDEKLEKAKALGAHFGINYTRQDFLREVRRITAKRGVDVVIEHLGGEVFTRSLLCLVEGGRLVTCGVTTGWDVRTDLRHIFFRQLRVMGTKFGSKACLSRIVQLAHEGKIRPVVDRVLPLSEARQAHRILESREHFGKVVLVP
ncbi:MAG: zinc-binding dehydrogenase [Candidatus Rokubacteria bacterium]|nr:zinc-binding dehydrogenase [Candidatus Rokubacteria bacterium]